MKKYIVYGNTFSSFEWLRSLYTTHHGAWRGAEAGGEWPARTQREAHS